MADVNECPACGAHVVVGGDKMECAARCGWYMERAVASDKPDPISEAAKEVIQWISRATPHVSDARRAESDELLQGEVEAIIRKHVGSGVNKLKPLATDCDDPQCGGEAEPSTICDIHGSASVRERAERVAQRIVREVELANGDGSVTVLSAVEDDMAGIVTAEFQSFDAAEAMKRKLIEKVRLLASSSESAANYLTGDRPRELRAEAKLLRHVITLLQAVELDEREGK